MSNGFGFAMPHSSLFRVAALTLKFLVISALSIVVTACSPSPRDPSYDNPRAVSIAYWPQRDSFLVGTAGGPSIYEMAPGTSQYTELATVRHEGRRQALRLAVDEKRGLLWIVQTYVVYIYKLPGQPGEPIRLLASLPLFGSKENAGACFPDITLAVDGRAFITSNVTPGITEVNFQPGTQGAAKRVFHLLLPLNPAQMPTGLSAVLSVPDSKFLIGADSRGGRLWRVNTESWVVSVVPMDVGLVGACGMAWEGPATATESPRLYVTRGGATRGRVTLAQLDRELSRAYKVSDAVVQGEPIFSLAKRGNNVFFASGSIPTADGSAKSGSQRSVVLAAISK